MEQYQDLYEGGAEVAAMLGVTPDELRWCQDWQYTYAWLEDLPKYRELYERPEASRLAKRVLGCFIFQCMEDHLAGGGASEDVERNLGRLAEDYDIHRFEFERWGNLGDDYYTEHPEDGFRVMATVREIMRQRDASVSS